jgi:hypothetical protein
MRKLARFGANVLLGVFALTLSLIVVFGIVVLVDRAASQSTVSAQVVITPTPDALPTDAPTPTPVPTPYLVSPRLILKDGPPTCQNSCMIAYDEVSNLVIIYWKDCQGRVIDSEVVPANWTTIWGRGGVATQ